MTTRWKDNVQYRFAPEMIEYRRFAEEICWQPYVMNWHPKKYRSEVINTDQHGFRLSCGPDGMPVSMDDTVRQRCSIVVGNSTAMGASASSDATHLASQLARIDGNRWLNFGGRGFTSTQEAIHFLYNRHRVGTIEDIVIFSGVIDLYCGFSCDAFDDAFGSLFALPEFLSVMNGRRRLSNRRAFIEALLLPVYGDRIDYRNVPIKALPRELLVAWRRPEPTRRMATSLQDSSIDNLHAAYPARRAGRDRILRSLERNLDIWRDVAASCGCRVTFALQPLPPWVQKAWSPEEQAIFDYFDAQESEWHECLKLALDVENHKWFSDGVRGLCEDRGLAFVDLNAMWTHADLDGRWLFVDMCHLNDAGFELAACCLKQYADTPKRLNG